MTSHKTWQVAGVLLVLGLLSTAASAQPVGSLWSGPADPACIPVPANYKTPNGPELSKLCGGAWHMFDRGGVTGTGTAGYLGGIWVTTADKYPAPADYTGDGFDDVSWFYQGVWNVYETLNPTPGAAPIMAMWLGAHTADCKPITGNFTGDAGLELATFCPSTATFRVFTPAEPVATLLTTFQAVDGGGTPLTGSPMRAFGADFDGDGFDTLTVFLNGNWWQYDYNTGTLDRNFWTGPASGGEPVPIDWDGDGSVEPAVFNSGALTLYSDDAPTFDRGLWIGNVGNERFISKLTQE